MAKRDQHYMEAQREKILRAALSTLVEKGVHETSLRDICEAAGVSNGGLYTHFSTKDEVVLAACAMDHRDRVSTELPGSWEAYVSYVFDIDAAGKRFRLSLQIAAELTRSASSPDVFSESYAMLTEFNRKALIHLRDMEIISMPYGVEATVNMHFQLVMGAYYQATIARSVPRKTIDDTLRQGLAVTAGLL